MLVFGYIILQKDNYIVDSSAVNQSRLKIEQCVFKLDIYIDIKEHNCLNPIPCFVCFGSLEWLKLDLMGCRCRGLGSYSFGVKRVTHINFKYLIHDWNNLHSTSRAGNNSQLLLILLHENPSTKDLHTSLKVVLRSLNECS